MKRDYAFLNLLRAFAACWVLVAHCTIWGGFGALPSPKLAVDLFMLISGFLMVATYRDMGPVAFWTRRFFRIAPCYYLALAVAVLCQGWFLDGFRALQALHPERWPAHGLIAPDRIHFTAENIGWHLSFLFGLSPTYTWSTFLPDWSLSLEMQFYAVFPLLALLMVRFGPIRAGVALALLGLFLAQTVASAAFFQEPSPLPYKLTYFLAGILACHALARDSLRIALAAVGVSALGFHAESAVPTCMLVLLLALGRAEVRGYALWLLRVTGSRLVTAASNVSYGVYLFHGFWISAYGLLAPRASPLGMLAFVGIGTYATATVVHYAVERPGSALGKRLLRHNRLDAAADAGGVGAVEHHRV